MSKEQEKIKDMIEKWTNEEGIFKEEKFNDMAYFHFIVEYPEKRHVNIFQPKERNDSILILSGINLDEEFMKRLNKLDKKERQDFMWDLRLGLLFRDDQFRIVPDVERIQRIQFTRPIYYDELTKGKLMNALNDNFKSFLFVMWKFQQKFGELAQREAENE